MNIQDYLHQHQPMIEKIFINAIKNGHLSHAYLLSGDQGTPLLEVAKFFAQSLICENKKPLADQTCLNCLRIADGNYADLIIYDGSSSTIKKNEIQSIETNFEMTPIEPAGKLIYILHIVENITPEAINSLLKFLEEPSQEVYALLTTENEQKVLPTIKSRSQILHFKQIESHLMIERALRENVDVYDSHLLGPLHYDIDLLKQYALDEQYIQIKEGLLAFIKQLAIDKSEAHFIYQTQLIDFVKSKESARLLLDLLINIIRDISSYQHKQLAKNDDYDKLIMPLVNRWHHIEDVLLELLLSRGRVDLNLSLPLLFEHVCLVLLNEEFL
jgi:DNA polymerase III subunit delta'